MRLPDPTETPTLTVEQAGQVLGVSRPTAYLMANSGEIPVLRAGRRLIVPTAALWRLLGLEPPMSSTTIAALGPASQDVVDTFAPTSADSVPAGVGADPPPPA